MKKYLILIAIASLSISCEDIFFDEEPESTPVAIFDDLWNTFHTDYAGFDQRNVDWNVQYDRYRPMLDENSSSDELYQVLTQMLSSLNDGHVELVAPNRKAFNSNKYMNQEERDGLFDAELIKANYLNNSFVEEMDSLNLYGTIDNIGYWRLKWISDNLFSTDKILDTFQNADGLIIDLRNNGGGDMTYSFSELGRLTNFEVYTHRSKTKDGPGKEDYTPWFNWYLKPQNPYFDKPIVLITDRYTLSAAERTTMLLKSLPNVIHVGDTTNGGHSTKILKELANGWYYSVAPQRIEFRDGTSYEGVGLAPDIFVKNTSTEINMGIDNVLETALEQFRKNGMN